MLFELVLDFEEAEMIRFALSCIASLAVSFLPTPLVSAFECLFASPCQPQMNRSSHSSHQIDQIGHWPLIISSRRFFGKIRQLVFLWLEKYVIKNLAFPSKVSILITN